MSKLIENYIIHVDYYKINKINVKKVKRNVYGVEAIANFHSDF